MLRSALFFIKIDVGGGECNNSVSSDLFFQIASTYASSDLMANRHLRAGGNERKYNEKVEQKRRKNAPFVAYGKLGIVPKISKTVIRGPVLRP